MKTIYVPAGKVGYHHKYGSKVISDTIFLCDNTSSAVAIKQTGGSLRLRNVYVKGGCGPLIEAGNYFDWVGGGGLGVTHKYGWGYYGNIHPGTNTRVNQVVFRGLRFPDGTKYEAMLRVMGVDSMIIDDCEAHSSYKQAAQFRHVKNLAVYDSDFGLNICWGALRRKDCASEKEYLAYHADAKSFRIRAKFDPKCRMYGYGMLTGQADLVFEGELHPPASRDKCFSLEKFPDISAPTLDVRRAKNVAGWKKVR